MTTTAITQIENLRKTVTTSFLKMGKLLLKVYHSGNFEGYSSFEEVVEQAADCSMTSARTYMELYTFYVEAYNQPMNRLANIGVTTLKMLMPVITSQKLCEKWLGKAETESRATLRMSFNNSNTTEALDFKVTISESCFEILVDLLVDHGAIRRNTAFDYESKGEAFEFMISELCRLRKLEAVFNSTKGTTKSTPTHSNKPSNNRVPVHAH